MSALEQPQPPKGYGGRRWPAEVLTADEVRRLIAACSHRSPTGLRNRALIATLYRGGLRISEALALLPKDVDLAAGTLTVLHGKGDKRRVVGIDPGACAILARWMDARQALGHGPRTPLFCTLEGRPVASKYVRKTLPRLARKAGIDKRVHAHGLRHTHAHELAGEGVPIHVIRDQLGHESLSTTDRYLRNIAPHLRIAAIRAREWQP